MYILRKREAGIVHDVGCYETLERLVNAAAGHAKNRQEHGRLIPSYEVEETDEISDVCRMAVDTFADYQNNTVAVEELSELQKEICKRMRGAENNDHMSEEIADVLIIIKKLLIAYDLEDSVAAWMAKKADRLRRKIEAQA